MNNIISDTMQGDDLPIRIEAALQDVRKHAAGMVHAAVRAGELLMQAKAAVPHGEWGQWLAEHCTIAPRTAQAYMRLAEALPTLPPQDAQRVADLPLREALNAITTAPTAPSRSNNWYLPPAAQGRQARSLFQSCVRTLGGFARDAGIRAIKPERIKAMRAKLKSALDELDRLADGGAQ